MHCHWSFEHKSYSQDSCVTSCCYISHKWAFFQIRFFTVNWLLLVLISLSLGGLSLILTLYKYVKTRRLAMGKAGRGGWWASRSSPHEHSSQDLGSETGNGTLSVSEGTVNTRKSIYDRALITRFTVGFVILAWVLLVFLLRGLLWCIFFNRIFEAAIIIFSVVKKGNEAEIVRSGGPDYSIGSAKADIAFFIPGATASLVVFLVFGTTKSWREYRDLILGVCSIRRRYLERRLPPIRDGDVELDELPTVRNMPTSLALAAKSKEVEDRVIMFRAMSPNQTESVTALAVPSPVISFAHFSRASEGGHRLQELRALNSSAILHEQGRKSPILAGERPHVASMILDPRYPIKQHVRRKSKDNVHGIWWTTLQEWAFVG